MSVRKPSKPSKAAEAKECPKCQGYGYFFLENSNTASRCDCGLYESLEAAQRLQKATLPQKYLNKGFENFLVDKNDKVRKAVLDAARAYAASFSAQEGQGLLLRGGVGSGKTHIAISILREVLRRGYSAHYTNFSDLLTRIRDSYHEDSDSREGLLLETVDTVDLLVLDDLGAESATDWVRDRLYLIINRRYENSRPVIITTNCSPDELDIRVGERTASRLYEMCPVPFPPFPKQDYRRAMLQ